MNIENREKVSKSDEPFFLKGKSKYGVLLVHGFTGTPNDVRKLGDFLHQKDFSVLGIKIAGHGTGDPHDLIRTSYHDWQNSVFGGYGELSKEVEKIFIVGFSMGGNLSFPLTYHYPDKVMGLVTVSCPIYITGQIVYRVALPFLKPVKTLYQKRGILGHRTDRDDITGALKHIPVKSFGDFLYLTRKISPPNLIKIQKPILIIHSPKDRLVRPKSAKYIYKKVASLNKELYWVENAGHHVLDNNQKEIFDKINDFFRSLV